MPLNTTNQINKRKDKGRQITDYQIGEKSFSCTVPNKNTVKGKLATIVEGDQFASYQSL